MDIGTFAILTQDGITNGAIYVLLAVALVLVFAVTRVIFIPQGEFLSYGALTLASLQLGKVPGTTWLLLWTGIATALVEIGPALRGRQFRRLPVIVGLYIAYPLAVFFLTRWLAPQNPHMVIQVVLMLLLIVPLGPMLYRLVYQPIAEASVLVLLIVSMAVHFALAGVGLLFFGAEGSRTTAFTEAGFQLGAVTVSGQSLFILAVSGALIVALYVFFEHTLTGKALRATAVNRMGARLVAVSITSSGRLAFTLAALIGALSGVLIAPITTIYYDSGFIIGLKGFVAAIVGGLASYPLAACGAVLVGLMESFTSFMASAYKEVIVFALIIPVLLLRWLFSKRIEEEEE
jgi:branched-chain amino acid transport system permease protein